METTNIADSAQGRVRTESRYHKVAVEIAHRIADGQYAEGEKLRSRTTLSAAFNVSPETARKAITVLTDLGIMAARQGSGVYVVSRQKAAEFAERYDNVRKLQELRSDMRKSIERQQKELSGFLSILGELEKQTEKSDLALAFSPYDLQITENCRFLGKTFGEVNLWNQTGATIVAVKRSAEYLISPGPHAAFMNGDTIYYVGDGATRQRIYQFLYGGSEENV